MTDLFRSILDIIRLAGPTGILFFVLGLGAILFILVGLFQAGSYNPKHHSDEYVKSHMGEFHNWFLKHPKDRVRYE